eukprot:696479-Pleurochrysis_carterae.AAC.1
MSTSCFCRPTSTPALAVRVPMRLACTSTLEPPFAPTALLQFSVTSNHPRPGLVDSPEPSSHRHRYPLSLTHLSAKGACVTNTASLGSPFGSFASFSAAAAAAWLVVRTAAINACAALRRSKADCAAVSTLLSRAAPA